MKETNEGITKEDVCYQRASHYVRNATRSLHMLLSVHHLDYKIF